MGRFDQLLQAAGIKPQHKARKRTVVLAKAVPVQQEKLVLPESPEVLRYELQTAVSDGRISATDARDILHQLATGETLPGDLAAKLKAILKVRAKRTPAEARELRRQLAQAVKDRKITSTNVAMIEHAINVGAELSDDLKIAIGKYVK